MEELFIQMKTYDEMKAIKSLFSSICHTTWPLTLQIQPIKDTVISDRHPEV